MPQPKTQLKTSDHVRVNRWTRMLQPVLHELLKAHLLAEVAGFLLRCVEAFEQLNAELLNSPRLD